ncbi:GNAT family N-acetyltransferase [Herbiconiux sp. P18]|uniref:GNAT family N-acetyltransferase n=1 Tax=Herbiconiux liangxiaofengii TaxID=3342795 RepID=UPI0035BAC19C
MSLRERTDPAATATEEFVYVAPDDPRAEPLLTELEREYDTRYGRAFGEPASAELARYPAEDFAPPRGAFVLLLRDGVAIAGGAFKPFDAGTPGAAAVEFKRIWASSAHRRQGLARRVVAELEAEARRRGVATAYLTTGPRQPEAQRLYFATGYTPLFDVTLAPEQVVIHGFAKSLTDRPLDLAAVQRAHDESLVEFYAAHPRFGAEAS